MPDSKQFDSGARKKPSLFRRFIRKSLILLRIQSHQASSSPEGRLEGDYWQFNRPVLLRSTRRASSLLVWVLVGSSGAVLGWACLAPLNETIAVKGKLQPGLRVRDVEAPAPGLVKDVLVRDGEQVRAGHLLVRFDLRDARSKLVTSRAIQDRLNSDTAVARAALGEIRPEGLTPNQTRQLISQRQKLLQGRLAAEREVGKSLARIQGLNTTVATTANLLQRYRDLANSGAASELQVLETANRLSQARSELSAEREELARARATLAEIQAGSELELRTRIESNLRELAQLDRDLDEAKRLLQYGEVRAPVDGLVFDVSVTPGSVVAQQASGVRPLLKIVPQDALQARVYIPNESIGFVRPGQRANISLDAFPSSDYGRIQARVWSVGSDALTAEEQARVLGQQKQGLFFPAVLKLDRQSLPVGRRSVPLQAGMALTADLQLRQRRFINVIVGFFEDKIRNLERLR
jgi:hemolysin D